MNAKFNHIGNTPLIEFNGSVPNNNRIWLKLECENPFGSHYDRVYLRLFEHFAQNGLLQPGAKVLETTSGSAGVSFAGIGRELGYKCLVAIPEGGERAREEAIRQEGAELIFTPKDEYVAGFPRFLKRYLVRNRDVVFLNHSMGPRGTENVVTTSALEEIGRELCKQLDPVDYFIAAVGNGSSILGPGRILKGKAQIVTFESFQSAVAYELMYPGRYEKFYRIKPGSLPRHILPGTSFQGIEFPHIRIAFKEECLVSKTVLVTDGHVDRNNRTLNNRSDTFFLPHWDRPDLWSIPYGRTTVAGIAVALKEAEAVSGKNFVVLAYDKPNRYDT
jgi:cysteine synthase